MRLQRKLFLAYQTRVFSIFTSTDKSYLTYPLPTCGMDKQVAQRATIAHRSPMCQGQISFKKKYINGPLKPEAQIELVWAFMPVLVTSNFDDEWASTETPFSHYKSMGIFLDLKAANSVVSGPIWPKFELVRDFMHVLVTCKYKKDRIKTRKSANIIFPIVSQWGLSVAMEQSFDPFCPKTSCSLSPIPIMLHV